MMNPIQHLNYLLTLDTFYKDIPQSIACYDIHNYIHQLESFICTDDYKIYQKPFLISDKVLRDISKAGIIKFDKDDKTYTVELKLVSKQFHTTYHPVTVGAYYEVDNKTQKYIYDEHGEIGFKHYEILINGEKLDIIYSFYACDEKNYAEVFDMLICNEEVFKFIVYIVDQELYKKKNIDVNVGTYTAYIYKERLVYAKLDNIKNSKVIHPVFDEIIEDIDFFFNKLLPKDIKAGRPGSRKVLLSGSPGTGKTSTIFNIVNKYKETHNVVFCESSEAFVKHLASVQKYDKPCIVIYEDCERLFNDKEMVGASSMTLNSLSGVYESKNENGTYIIMTTNEPHKIQDKVKKRPDRVDINFNIGPLTGSYASDCFEYYLNNYFDKKLFDIEKVKTYFDRNDVSITGAEIMNVVIYIMNLAIKKLNLSIRNNEPEKQIESFINDELIEEVLELIEKRFKESDNVDTNKSDLQKAKGKIKF